MGSWYKEARAGNSGGDIENRLCGYSFMGPRPATFSQPLRIANLLFRRRFADWTYPKEATLSCSPVRNPFGDACKTRQWRSWS